MSTNPRNGLASMVVVAAIAVFSGPLAAQEAYRAALSSSELDRIREMTLPQLLLATLSVSRDLKDHDKYHCLYDPALGPMVCDHMNTTSGQYEDFYQSTMSSCEKSELCEGASLGIAAWDYMVSDKRICKHLITGSCAKEVLNEQDVRQELLDLLQLERKTVY
ncbi:MAG: hypothetical protein K2X67_03040 [Burkholderiales bacterium]|nr:hypothetical protein [Burkholderiales bacterium]